MFHRMMNYGEMDARPTVVITRDLVKKSMPKFKRHEDLIVVQESAWEEFKKSLPIPVANEENSPFSIDEDELASLVCQTVQKPICRRLAIEKGIKNDSFRTPDVELILGDNAIVTHRENHITYRFDITKCMFSFGNINEKMRMAELDCSEQIVVDLFAGIGYFSLPLLIHSKAKHLYACEWNPDAIDAFKKNITINKVNPARCTILEGDNRSNRPTDVAQRVILGILPSCLYWMKTAFECIDKSTGATLHCHDLVETKPLVLQQQQHHFGETQTSCNSAEISSADKVSLANNSLLNQSLTSSSSSHSTIEKLSVPTDDKILQSSESDKDTNSPVLLEKPSEVSTNSSSIDNGGESGRHNNSNDTFLSVVSASEESINHEPPTIEESQQAAYEARADLLISQIKEDVEAHDLTARLTHIQPVKSYAPYVTHVVFDIKIEPRSTTTTNSNNHTDIIRTAHLDPTGTSHMFNNNSST